MLLFCHIHGKACIEGVVEAISISGKEGFTWKFVFKLIRRGDPPISLFGCLRSRVGMRFKTSYFATMLTRILERLFNRKGAKSILIFMRSVSTFGFQISADNLPLKA